jgi:hypothetical protein
VIASAALAVVAAPAAAQPAGCDYANAPYEVRDLPLRGGYFSPDSRKLAFPEGGELKAYDIAGGGVESLYRPADGGPPVTQVLQWTVRGEIYFTRGAAAGGRPTPDEDPNRAIYGQVWVARSDGSEARRVEVLLPEGTEAVEYGVPKVSPDGRRVGYTFLSDAAHQAQGKPINGWRLAIADVSYAEDGAVRFERPRFLTDDSYYNEAKDWSGDSSKFVFASTRGSDGDRRSLNSDAYVIDAQSGEITRLTHTTSWEEAHDLLRGDLGPGDADVYISDQDTPNPITSPGYSLPSRPNGSDSVLVALSVPALAAWTSHELFVAGHLGDRGWTRRLTFDYRPGPEGWVARVPIWSPDGRHVRFDQWRAHGATALGQRERLISFDCGLEARPRPRLWLRVRDRAKGRRCRIRASVGGADRRAVRRAVFHLGRRGAVRDEAAPFRAVFRIRRARRTRVRAEVDLADGRHVTLRRAFRACAG